jgi:cytochrome c-type biogenesis protein CcmH
MILWLIFAVMTAAAVLGVTWPLIHRGEPTPSGSDVAVYCDQLDEVERDRAAGLIGEPEAAAARVEISRRLLAAADAQTAAPAEQAIGARLRRRVAAGISLLLVPIVAVGLYLRLGSPELASGRAAVQHNATPAGQSVESSVAQVEAHLQRKPGDGRGWEVLAPVYIRLGRYADAVAAWRKTLRLLGESAERDANLGEALTAEADGVVTDDAKAAFLRAMTLDKTNVTARYYLGLAAEQHGQRDEAAKIWRDLLASAPPRAFWVSDVRNALARVEGKSVRPTGPTAAQMAAAANESPAHQTAMINSMIDRLAARLKRDGADVDGWVRLIRSYNVLGEADKARDARVAARTALAGDPGKQQRLNAALQQLDANGVAASAPASSAATRPVAGPPPDHQGVTMQQLVERLAERLNASGADPEGWLTLVRSYESLGEKEKATAAIGNARRALAGNPDELQQFHTALGRFDGKE